ncbi:CPCC family cysteine-rich protein [Streptomyces sp. NRRL S-646]|uniref:CPCC family cysteine-rich protein n=1 Tax=Streptomyces sp. NRRL S-646 TaxID=1463917 RepID=UPI000564DE19
MTRVILKYPCVCCGHLTMDEPPGSYQICPVCFWEDDAIQLRWPDYSGGANRPSLIEAQENYEAFGACAERSVEHVRPPEDDEPMDPSWRPIDPERDRFEPGGIQLAAWPNDRTVLYWWRYRNTDFWRPADG